MRWLTVMQGSEISDNIKTPKQKYHFDLIISTHVQTHFGAFMVSKALITSPSPTSSFYRR